MFGNSNKPVLIHKTSGGKRRRVKLGKKEVIIGKGRSSTIRIQGEYVSDEHARIYKTSAGDWSLENLSPNGTIVNSMNVEQCVLGNSDIIQIGAVDSFAVEGLKQEQTASKSTLGSEGEADDTHETNNKKGSLNWKHLVGGVVYLGAVGFFVVKLLESTPIFSRESPDVFTLDLVNENVREHARYLGDQMSVNISEDDLFSASKQQSSAGLNYDDIWNNDLDPSEKEKWILEMSASVRNQLVNAYWLNQQGSVEESIKVLEDLVTFVPDFRDPITQYSLSAIAELKKSIAYE